MADKTDTGSSELLQEMMTSIRVTPVIGFTLADDEWPIGAGTMKRIPRSVVPGVVEKAARSLDPRLVDQIVGVTTHGYVQTNNSGTGPTTLQVAAKLLLCTTVWMPGSAHIASNAEWRLLGISSSSADVELPQVSHLSEMIDWDPPRELSEQKLLELGKIHDEMAPTMSGSTNEPVSRAAHQLLRGDVASGRHRRLFEYVLGLETLLLPQGGELRFRFGAILGELCSRIESKKKAEWYKLGMRLYNLRSGYVHGPSGRSKSARYPSASDVADARYLLRVMILTAARVAGVDWPKYRENLYENAITDDVELSTVAATADMDIENEIFASTEMLDEFPKFQLNPTHFQADHGE